MALETYRGREDMSNIADRDITSGNMRDMLVEIELGNTLEVQQANELNRMFDTMTEVIEAEDGAPYAISKFNLKFTKGSVEGSSPKFREYMTKFTMNKDTGYNAVVYDFSQKAILDADEKGYDIWAKALKNTQGAQSVYINSMLPSRRLKALLSGTSYSTSIPTENIGGAYEDQPGALRGEDVESILLPGYRTGSKNRNHYFKLSNTTGVTDEDIRRASNVLRQYKTFSKRGIIAMASPEFISNLGSLYGYEDNQDDFIKEYITSTKILGINFVSVDYFDPDFVVFMDFGKYLTGKILAQRVSPSPRQQGWALMPKKSLVDFVSGLEKEGAKLHVFPTEWYMFNREAISILDVNTGRGGSSVDFYFDADNVTALNNFLEALEGEYDDQVGIA